MRATITRRTGLILVALPLVVLLGLAAASAGPDLPAGPPQVPGAAESPTPTPSSSPSPAITPTVPTVPLPSPLSYRIATTYRAPDGQLIEKSTNAILLVPTPVDVDGDLEHNQTPDVLAQLTIDAGRATFRTSTFPGGTLQLPLRIEAILDDPRGSTNLKVAFGYDALSSAAPAVFSSTIQLIGSDRVTSLGLDIETAGAGSTLAVVGAVYEQGPNGSRIDPQDGRIEFSPVPAAAHFGILQGSDFGIQQSGVDLSTETPTRAQVVIRNIRGVAEQRTDLLVDKVPNVLSLVLTDQADGRKTYGYQATARVARLELTVSDLRSGQIAEQFALLIEDMATRVTLVQDTPTHATFTADGPVGSIGAGSANGRAISWLEDPAYLYSTDRGAGDSFAFRVRGLTRAEYDTGDPFLVDVDIAPGPFLVRIEDGARTLNARITDLPGHVRLRFSETTGTIDYTGSGAIGRIAVDITDPDGISGRATEMHLVLDDVPTQLSMSFGAAGQQIRLDAGGSRVGLVTFLLTSGPQIEVEEGFDGVVLEDVPAHYAVAVRLTGLRLVSVSTGDAPYTLELRKNAGPFLIALTQGTRTLRIEVRNLPDALTATIDPAGRLEYSASAGIGSILAGGFDPEGLSGRATRLRLSVTDVPAALRLDFSSADATTIDANDVRIGSIDLLLTSGPEPVVDEGFDGIVLEDVDDHYFLAARITGLKLASVSTAAPYALTLTKDAGPFLVRLRQQQRFVEVKALDLPSSITATLDPSGALEYTASDGIERFTVFITDPAGVSGRGVRLWLDIRGLPQALTLDLPATGRVSLDAHGSTIGLIDFLLTSGPDLSVDEGYDGIVLRDTDALFAIAVRLNGLELAAVSTSAPYSLQIAKEAGPFLVDMVQDARTTRVEVHDLPDSLAMTLDPAGGAQYTGSAPIDRVSVNIADPAGVSGRATSVRLDLVQLPAQLDVAFGAGQTVSVDANGGSIGLIDLLATSGPVLALPGGYDGVSLEDLESHYAFAVRLSGLRLVSVSTAAPYALDIRKDAGPFLVNLAQGARTTRLEILNLPTSLQATLDPAGSLSYQASASIASLIADVTDPAGVAGRATKFHLDVGGLPPALSLSFSADSSVSLDAGEGSIGHLEMTATSGPPVEVEAGYDGVVLDDLQDRYGLAVRMTGLRSASVSTAPPYSLTLVKSASPFLIRLTQPARTTRVAVHDLPGIFGATLDPAGHFSYTASAGIGFLTATLTGTEPVLGRATRVQLDMTSLPGSVALDFDASSAVGLDAHGMAIGSITFLATSGPDLTVDPGYEGVVMEDLPDRFAIAARLTGLSAARVTTGQAPYTLTLAKNPGPFLARLTQGARVVEVKINDLPSSLTATLDPAGSLAYNASAPVGQITASIVDPAGVSGRATRATALLQGLPQSLDVSWAGADGAVTADAHGATVGLIEVMLTSGPVLTLPAARDGFVVQDLTGHYAVFGRITGLRSITLSQGPPPSFDIRTAGGRVFEVSLATQDPEGVATMSAVLDALPAQASIAFTSATALQYRASAGMTRLTIDAYDPAGISGRAKQLRGTLEGVPVALDATWAADGTITLDARGGTAGLVELQLTSGPDDRIASGFDGILLNDLADRYVVFARLTSLQKAVATQSPQPDITINTTGNRVLKVDVNQLSGGKVTYTRATLDRLPSTTRVRMAESPQRVFYTASAATNSLTFQTNSGDRWGLDASIAPLPASFSFCSDGGGGCSSVGRSDAGSFAFDASAHTTINLFDCKRPLNSSCVRGGGSEYVSVDNVNLKKMVFNAGAASSGFDGETYSDTDWNTVTGHIRLEQSNAIDIDFGTFRADDHRVKWTGWGIWPFTPDRSGPVSCSGTDVDIRVIGIWIGITNFVC